MAQMPNNYCYVGPSCGPKNWSYWNPTCGSTKEQSPININPDNTTKAKPDKTMIFSSAFYAVNSFTMVNTGHSVGFVEQVPKGTSIVEGVPLTNIRVKGAGWNGVYSFGVALFRWGAEHLIKGNSILYIK